MNADVLQASCCPAAVSGMEDGPVWSTGFGARKQPWRAFQKFLGCPQFIECETAWGESGTYRGLPAFVKELVQSCWSKLTSCHFASRASRFSRSCGKEKGHDLPQHRTGARSHLSHQARCFRTAQKLSIRGGSFSSFTALARLASRLVLRA
jgi:hypothetical protein